MKNIINGNPENIGNYIAILPEPATLTNFVTSIAKGELLFGFIYDDAEYTLVLKSALIPDVDKTITVEGVFTLINSNIEPIEYALNLLNIDKSEIHLQLFGKRLAWVD